MIRSHPDAVFEELDVIFALDTNTKVVNANKISVTGVVLATPQKCKNISNTLLGFAPVHCLEFWNSSGSAERIGWAEAISCIIRNPDITESIRIGLIVDAHLEDLSNINKRKEPVYGDIYLPPNSRLIYASSDKKNDSVANMLLALADKEAKALLQSIIERDSEENLQIVEGKPFTHFRFWNLET